MVQIEKVCRQQFQIAKSSIGLKTLGKEENGQLLLFPLVFLKDLYCTHIKARACWRESNFTPPTEFVFDEVENIVEKEKMLVTSISSFLHNVFIEKALFYWVLKGWALWSWVNSIFNIQLYHSNITNPCFLNSFPKSPGFYVSAVKVFWKHCEKSRNCSLSVHLKNCIPFSSHSSANS